MTEDQEQPQDPEGPLFQRIDAATLVSVEGANGGEWAGLGQVIVTFQVMFGRRPGAEEFTESCGLLCEARLIEYGDGGLGLSAEGRKLLRRAGTEGSPGRPAKVTEMLQELDEDAMADQGSVPEPSVDEVAAALEDLTDDVTRDLERVQASNELRLGGPPMVLPVKYGLGARYDTFPGLQPDEEAGAQMPGEDTPSGYPPGTGFP
jgi:hypothetical protein